MPSTRTLLLATSAALVLLPWLPWRLPAVRRVAPLAVVQILAGVALGPSLLGRLAPGFHAALFTPGVLAALQGVATLGVLLSTSSSPACTSTPAVAGTGTVAAPRGAG